MWWLWWVIIGVTAATWLHAGALHARFIDPIGDGDILGLSRKAEVWLLVLVGWFGVAATALGLLVYLIFQALLGIVEAFFYSLKWLSGIDRRYI